MRKLSFVLLGVLLATGCAKKSAVAPLPGQDPYAQDGRNAAAALQGSIQAAQEKYTVSCSRNNQIAICQSIQKAVAAQNVLVDAIETYCGWSTLAPPDAATKCVPVTSGKQTLIVATQNANKIITDLKGSL